MSHVQEPLPFQAPSWAESAYTPHTYVGCSLPRQIVFKSLGRQKYIECATAFLIEDRGRIRRRLQIENVRERIVTWGITIRYDRSRDADRPRLKQLNEWAERQPLNANNRHAALAECATKPPSKFRHKQCLRDTFHKDDPLCKEQLRLSHVEKPLQKAFFVLREVALRSG